MDKANIENIIEGLVAPTIQEMKYDLVHVELVKENREWYLRIYIDNEDGINIDDCTKVSRIISDLLDEKDPIPDSYYLEISSPGPDRPLKKDSDFERFEGKNIFIKFIKSVEGKKSIKGILAGLQEGKIIVRVDGEELKIDRENVSQVRLNE